MRCSRCPGTSSAIGDTTGILLRVNPAWETTLGYPAAELEGRPLIDLVHPDDRAGTLAGLAELAKGHAVTDFANRQRHRDGSYRLIEWRVTPMTSCTNASSTTRSPSPGAPSASSTSSPTTSGRIALSTWGQETLGIDAASHVGHHPLEKAGI